MTIISTPKRNSAVPAAVAAFAGLMSVSSVIQTLTHLHDSLLLTIVYGSGTVGWFVAMCICLKMYRTRRLRGRGWIVGDVRRRREFFYVGEGQAVTKQDWDAFIQQLTNKIYRVNENGTMVERQVLADHLHTPVGLVNDLYPIDTGTSLAATADRFVMLSEQADDWQKYMFLRNLKRLYRRSGWLRTLDHAINTSYPRLGTLAFRKDYERAKAALQAAFGFTSEKAHDYIMDHWLLHEMLAQPDMLAMELTHASRPFHPNSLSKQVNRWHAAYAKLMFK